MADELQTKRIIELAQKTEPEEGDNLAVDNATSGTRRILWENLLDDSLSDDTKAAPAGVTGKAIEDSKTTFTDTGDGNIAVNYDEDVPAGTEVPLQSIRFPLMPYKYTVPQITTDLTQLGKAADAKAVGDKIDELKNDLSSIGDDVENIISDGYSLLDVSPSTTVTSYELTGTGICKYIVGYKMTKYSVDAGDKLYIKASKDGNGVYQFQKSASVPSSGENSNLVGEPVNTSVNRVVEVPTGATYLIISSLEANITNRVARAIQKDASLGDFFDGIDNVVISNMDTEYVATSSSTWQGGYQIKMDVVPPSGVKTIVARADSANGYGSQLITFVFYSDESKTTEVGRLDISDSTFNTRLKYEREIPENTKIIAIRSALISTNFSQDHIPVAGDIAYLKGLSIYFDSVSLLPFIDIPKMDEIDQSVIYELSPNWAEKIQTIQTEQNGNFTFAVQTDTHFGSVGTGIYKNQYSDLINNLSKLTEYVGFDFICNLGDIIRGYESDTTDDMREALTELMHRYVTNLRCPLLVTCGNHDTNLMYAEAQNNPSLQILKPELYSRLMPFVMNSTKNIVFNGRSLYYYVDFESSDIRVIMLNTTDGNITSEQIGSAYTFSAEQINWFTNTALNTDKKIVFMCHIPLVSELTASVLVNGTTVLNALKTWKQNGGNLIGCFYGHTHEQSSATVDGILHVCFTNGGYCTEIVMIDTDSKTINTIGIGTDTQGHAVVDRTFNY